MRIRLSMSAFASCLIGLALAFTAFEPAAAGVIWDGGGVNDNIDNPANWDGDTLPALTGSTDNLVFAGTNRLMPLINIPISPLGFRFDASAGGFVIGGTNTITTGTTTTTNGDIVNDSPLVQTIKAPISFRRGALNAAAGDLVINGTFNVGGGSGSSGRSLTVVGSHDVYLNGTIEGTGTTSSQGGVISKTSTGLLHITSNSPLWQGRIGIDTGVLRISAPDALGDPNSRTLVQGGGSTGKSRLELTGGITFAPERLELTGRETGSSPIHLSNFSGNNTWTGDAVLLTGGAEYGFDSAAGKLTITGNVVNRTNNATARQIRFSGAAEGEFAGQFLNDTGTGALTIRKEGAGKWTISNPFFTYLGDTLITGGTLAFGPGILINNTPKIEVAAGATLDLSGGNLDRINGQAVTGAGTIAGHVTDLGAIFTPGNPGIANSPATLTLGGNLTLNGGGTFNFDLADVTTVGGGVNDLVNVGGNLSLAGTTNIQIHPLAGAVSNGTYRLFNYGGTLTGNASNLQLVFGATRQSAIFDTATANQVNLVVSGAAANLVWTGDGGFNFWDINNSVTWRNGGLPDKFFNLDNVTFDDTAGAINTTVNITETVTPGSVTVNSALDYTFTGGGKISGVTGITKSGSGKLTIDTNNDNSGTTMINLGTLQVGAGSNTGSLGTGPVVNNSALVFNRSTGVAVPGVISGPGTLLQQGTGTVTLAADNTYTGATTIVSGTLQIGNGGATGSIGPGNIIDNGLVMFNRDTDLVVPNLITGTGAVDKRGSGAVEFTAVNTYTGSTTINTSTLLIDNIADGGIASDIGASTSDAANLHIRTNGTLKYVGPGVRTDRLFTIGNAKIEAAGTGPLVFTNAGTIATSGGNRTLTLQGANTQDNLLAAAIVDSGPTGVTSFAKIGDGTWVISGNSSFSGAATISAGTLRLASATALGATEPLSGNTDPAGTTITGDVGGSGRLLLAGGITFAPEPITLQARQGVTAAIPHLVNFSGDNHWTGPITLTTGGFEYTFQSDLGTMIIDSNITQAATTLERFINLQGGSSGVINGVISNGTGSQVQSLRKRGAGTWTLNGVNAYIGSTTVEEGTLVSNSGITGPGATMVGNGAGPAMLVASHVRQASLTISIGSRATLKTDGGASVVGELLIPAGGPVVPGTLDINNNKLIVDYAATASNPEGIIRQRIIEGRGGVGFGATWTGNGITSGTAAAAVATEPESRSVAYANNSSLPLGAYATFSGQPVDDTTVLISYTRTADANLDGIVNDDDVTIVGATYAPGLPNPFWALGDFDYNGFIDDDDVTLLGVFYNPSAPPIGAPAAASGAVVAVPEPSTMVLLIGAAAALAIAAVQSKKRTGVSRR